MEVLSWVLVILLWIGSFIGLIYPILPSSILIYGSYFLYGWLVTFEEYNWFFWTIQTCLFLLLFLIDYLANALGIKRYGGTKPGIWGSTIGLLIGPFIIPFAGFIIGPFIGAILAEMMIHKVPFKKAVKIGMGAVVGFIGSVMVKGVMMLGMILYFILTVL